MELQKTGKTTIQKTLNKSKQKGEKRAELFYEERSETNNDIYRGDVEDAVKNIKVG